MNLLKDKESTLYRKYLIPSFGSAMIMSIYIMADAIAIGKGIGPLGISALNITTPLLCVLMSTGLLFGIGGATLMSFQFGQKNKEAGQNYFTVSLIGILITSGIYWILYYVFLDELMVLLGATPKIYDYVKDYMFWINLFLPVLVLSNFMSAFVRNDGDPNRAMLGVICGGILNIFLDYLFVFPLQLGMGGAALASALGMCLSLIIVSSHVLSKHNHLKWIRPTRIGHTFKKIVSNGLSSFVNEFSNGLIVCLFNLQILRYADEMTLSVYGVISNCAILFTSLFCGIGQAIQPLVATNHGAKQKKRIHSFAIYGYITALILGMIVSASGIFFPDKVVHLFMTATPEIQQIANTALPVYFIAFFFMGINLLSTYYLQSLTISIHAFIISILRSIILSCSLIFVLPGFMGMRGIWIVMPIAEFFTCMVSIFFVYKSSHK